MVDEPRLGRVTVVRNVNFAVGADTDLPTYDASFVRLFGGSDLRVLAANDRVDAAASPERTLYIDTHASAPNTSDPYRVSALVRADGNDSGIVGARADQSSGGNGYFLIARPGSSAIILARLDNGNIFTIDGGPVSHTFSTGTYTLGIECETVSGSAVRVRAYLDNSLIGSLDDTNASRKTTGRPILGLEGASSVWLDDYSVDNLAAAGALGLIAQLTARFRRRFR